jgi:hypothetical protein
VCSAHEAFTRSTRPDQSSGLPLPSVSCGVTPLTFAKTEYCVPLVSFGIVSTADVTSSWLPPQSTVVVPSEQVIAVTGTG